MVSATLLATRPLVRDCGLETLELALGLLDLALGSQAACPLEGLKQDRQCDAGSGARDRA